MIAMAENPPPPPPPPKKGGAPPPPPAKRKAPPPPGKRRAPPPPGKRRAPPPPGKRRAPPPAGKRPAPGKKRPAGPPPKGAPKGPPKGKPKGAPSAKKKRKRRLRIKLGLRESEISEADNQYKDELGWTVHGTILEDMEASGPKEPEIINHQCSMCGSMMQIPRPKRDRYKVECAYPECGHSDMIGL